MNKPSISILIASSLDGRIAFPNGGESHIGSDQDKRILNENLSLVDATIFGLGTLKAHKSTYLVRNFCKNGKNELSKKQPISILATNSKIFNKKWSYFQQPITRWIISSNKNNLNVSYFKKEIIFRDSWEKTLLILKNEGINNIALIGGAKLINSFIKEDLIDEIKITIVPRIIGGKFTWIPTEETEKIFNLRRYWIVKSIRELSTSEIFVHYIKKD